MSVPRRHTIARTRLAVAALVGALVLVLAGCGGDDAATDAPAEGPDAEAPADDAPADDAPADDEAADDSEEAAAEGICGLLDGVDVDAAFAGTLSLGPPTSTAPDNCVIPVDGAEGSGVFIRTFDATFYELKLEAAETSGAEVRNPDLGQGAVLVGNGDLTVLVDDETTLYAGVDAFFTEVEPPSDEVFRTGVVSMAEQVLDNV